MYNHYNIFEIAKKYDICTSYTVAVCDGVVNKRITDLFMYRCDIAKNKSSKQIGKSIKCGIVPLYAPTACYKVDILNKKYNWFNHKRNMKMWIEKNIMLKINKNTIKENDEYTKNLMKSQVHLDLIKKNAYEFEKEMY